MQMLLGRYIQPYLTNGCSYASQISAHIMITCITAKLDSEHLCTAAESKIQVVAGILTIVLSFGKSESL
jgi:hypothetical protein